MSSRKRLATKTKEKRQPRDWRKKYRVLAFDYDGTLAYKGHLASEVARVIHDIKQVGFKCILVTGRILDDLLTVCPHINLFDVLVVENGAVVYWTEKTLFEDLGKPAPNPFFDELGCHSIPYQTGRIIVGLHRCHADQAQMLINQNGWHLQIIYNKDAAMVLPNGIDKGTGLSWALRRLGVNESKVIAMGDAENDLPLFTSAGVSVAPANALDEVKYSADIVLDESNGNAVKNFIDQYLLGDRVKISQNTST